MIAPRIGVSGKSGVRNGRAMLGMGDAQIDHRDADDGEGGQRADVGQVRQGVQRHEPRARPRRTPTMMVLIHGVLKRLVDHGQLTAAEGRRGTWCRRSGSGRRAAPASRWTGRRSRRSSPGWRTTACRSGRPPWRSARGCPATRRARCRPAPPRWRCRERCRSPGRRGCRSACPWRDCGPRRRRWRPPRSRHRRRRSPPRRE